MNSTKEIDKKVREIYHRFKIGNNPTCNELKVILEKLGYVPHKYTYEHIKTFGKRIPPAYTVESNDSRMVLYNDALSDQDLIIAFTHELAHIVLCHSHRCNGPDDTSTYKDYEANIFVYKFLNYRHTTKKRIASVMSFIICLVLLTAPVYIRQGNNSNNSVIPSEQESVVVKPSVNEPEVVAPAVNEYEVIITKTGSKYHKPTCYYVKYKTNTTTLTEAEAIKANKKPCTVCLP